jgi:hypothetical protein
MPVLHIPLPAPFLRPKLQTHEYSRSSTEEETETTLPEGDHITSRFAMSEVHGRLPAHIPARNLHHLLIEWRRYVHCSTSEQGADLWLG